MNQKNQPNRTNNPKKRNDALFILVLIVVIIGFFVFSNNLSKSNVSVLEENKVILYAEENRIKSLSITPVGELNEGLYNISGKYTFDGKDQSFKSVVSEASLQKIKDALPSNVPVVNKPLSSNFLLELLLTFLPIIIIVGVIIFFMRSNSSGNNRAFDFAKSRARLSRDKTTTFKDVAGCDEEKAELEEIIDFLKTPKKYVDIGARIPKGVLLVGPPGTGKTLIAKAVAGEASVPFFSISGSDFVEMFVGVGASRVRDLFKTAKENAPCIIFIDEIDAVGRQRGAGMGGGHDEREQTLNQLLVEMDGFQANLGIIMIAATNRPDVLDPALLRPGRFDRQITIPNPDVKGREDILKVHAKNKKLEPSIKLDEIAQRIPGFSGADIENLLNEAALLAARENRTKITTNDIDEATDRVLMGPAKRSRKTTEKERIIVAHHEAGHAVIGLKLENANIVQKVTIVPRGQTGGYVLLLPEEETYNKTRSALLDRIISYLAGRVSEEINFGDVTTGAHHDFQQATKIARAMVTEYGMSSLGPVQYEQNSGDVFLGRDYLKEKNFSDAIAHDIDLEVRKIIDECYEKARVVLTENMSLLKAIAEYLLKVETLTKSDIEEIAKTNRLAWYDEKEQEKPVEQENTKSSSPVDELPH